MHLSMHILVQKITHKYHYNWSSWKIFWQIQLIGWLSSSRILPMPIIKDMLISCILYIIISITIRMSQHTAMIVETRVHWVIKCWTFWASVITDQNSIFDSRCPHSTCFLLYSLIILASSWGLVSWNYHSFAGEEEIADYLWYKIRQNGTKLRHVQTKEMEIMN